MKKEAEKKTKKQIPDEGKESKQDNKPAPEGVPSDEGKEETSELEEDIKDAEKDLDENQFQEFVQQSSTNIAQPTESFSPVLKRVEAPQQITDLEQNVASTQLSGGEAEDTAQTKYSSAKPSENYAAKSKSDDETYTESRNIDENLPVSQPTSINIETAGRDLHPQLRDVAPVNSEFQELRKPQGTLEVKYIQPEKIDREKVGRETPFETRIQEVEKKKLDYEIK